jgi:hypothetical protein
MLAVPALIKVNTPSLVIVATLVAFEVNVTVKPVAVVLAISVGVVPKLCAPGSLNVIVCAAFGVTLSEAVEAALVPAVLVAVTVNVYAVPLVSPVTEIGEAKPVPVRPPGLDVTV